MKRYVTLEEISDGRLYGLNDMVKADCNGCAGCSECCRGMGSSIILDPLDAYRLTMGLQKSFEEFLEKEIELNIVDGVILPNLKMVDDEERCSFLDNVGRCSIHALRPGICRLFPLGRYYEEEGFRYFLQKSECSKTRSKIKVSKWIDTPNIQKNQAFINSWHKLLKQVEEAVLGNEEDVFRKKLQMLFLNTFYFLPYDKDKDFYEQYEERLRQFTSIFM